MKDTNTRLQVLYLPLEVALQGRRRTLLPTEYWALVTPRRGEKISQEDLAKKSKSSECKWVVWFSENSVSGRVMEQGAALAQIVVSLQAALCNIRLRFLWLILFGLWMSLMPLRCSSSPTSTGAEAPVKNPVSQSDTGLVLTPVYV